MPAPALSPSPSTDLNSFTDARRGDPGIAQPLQRPACNLRPAGPDRAVGQL